MDEVEFLFQCVRDGKLSKEQAEAILNKKSSSSVSPSHSFIQKAATFSAPGSSKHQQHYCSNHCSNHCEDSKVAAALGDKKTPDGGSKRAELLMKYKTLQKQNREASCSKTNKSLKSKSTRNPIFLKISMGGMRYDEVRQCGVRSKELGPIVSMSIPPYARYEEMVMKAKEQFFANDLKLTDDPHNYFLADAQGSKITENIGGKPWNLTEYLHAHGIYPSKTKIYCVQQDCKSAFDDTLTTVHQKTDHQVKDHQKTIPYGHVIDISHSEDSGEKEMATNQEVRTPSNDIVIPEADPFLVSPSAITLGRKLGEGGYGTVYLSQYNGTRVAVKKLKLDKKADNDHMSEIKALSALRHPNIVLFMGYTSEEDNIQIITNYVDGSDLHRMLFTEKRLLSPAEKNSIAEQTAQALTYMHSLNPPMIHRDVKPLNILVERGTLHVYMCDMGLAKIKVGCSTMTCVQIVGTPCYAAPETFEGTAGKPSDVWSFGMVYLELCGGQRAWGSVCHYNELVKHLLLKKVPDFSYLNFRQQQICRGCLTHDTKQRKTMEQILSMIRASLTE